MVRFEISLYSRVGLAVVPAVRCIESSDAIPRADLDLITIFEIIEGAFEPGTVLVAFVRPDPHFAP